MKLKILIFLWVFPAVVQGSPHQDYMRTYLPQVEAHLEADYPGPIGRELASMALARQILEDGLNKGPRYSVPGIGVGPPNREIVEPHVFQWLKVGKVSDWEGTWYSFKGPQANICAATIIARLFDSYVYRFLPKMAVTWDMAKDLSRHIDDTPCPGLEATYEALRPEEVVKRVNRMYGPNGQSVENINDR